MMSASPPTRMKWSQVWQEWNTFDHDSTQERTATGYHHHPHPCSQFKARSERGGHTQTRSLPPLLSQQLDEIELEHEKGLVVDTMVWAGQWLQLRKRLSRSADISTSHIEDMASHFSLNPDISSLRSTQHLSELLTCRWMASLSANRPGYMGHFNFQTLVLSTVIHYIFSCHLYDHLQLLFVSQRW